MNTNRIIMNNKGPMQVDDELDENGNPRRRRLPQQFPLMQSGPYRAPSQINPNDGFGPPSPPGAPAVTRPPAGTQSPPASSGLARSPGLAWAALGTSASPDAAGGSSASAPPSGSGTSAGGGSSSRSPGLAWAALGTNAAGRILGGDSGGGQTSSSGGSRFANPNDGFGPPSPGYMSGSSTGRSPGLAWSALGTNAASRILGGGSGSSQYGSGGQSAPNGSATTFNPTLRDVDYSRETIQGRLGNLLGTDAHGNYTNSVVRQAADKAMEQFASRGLLNSSMAAQAAQEAAIAKAIEIAGPDAQTYFSQGRANQDAQNVFTRDRQQNAFDQAKLDRTMALDWAKLQQDDKHFYDNLKARLDELKLSDENRARAEEVAHRRSKEIANNKTFADAYEMYIRRLQEIDLNTSLGANEKAEMKNRAGADLDRLAAYLGTASGMNLSERFSTLSRAGSLDRAPGHFTPTMHPGVTIGAHTKPLEQKGGLLNSY